MPGPPVPLSLAPPATPNHGSAGYRPPAVWPDGILRGSEALTDLTSRSVRLRGVAGERGPGDRGISNREHRGVSVSRPAAVIVLAAGEVDPERLIVLVGHRRREVTDFLNTHAPDATAVVQHRQGGTGHAVRTAIEAVGLDHGTIVVTYADAPLLRAETLAALIREHWAQDAAATALTARLADPTGYGRIIRDDAGAFMEIIE